MFRIFNQYVSVKGILLAIVESVVIALCLACAARLRFWNNPAELIDYQVGPDFPAQVVIVVLVCIGCFYCNDLYNLTSRNKPLEHILRVEQSLGAASLLLGLFYFLFPRLLPPRGVFLIGMALAAFSVLLG